MEERDDIDLETTETEHTHIDGTELEDDEATVTDKLKKLQGKLKRVEEEKMTALEDLARVRADFLNARRRMDEERTADRERTKLQFVEDLLPLCDSFTMALADPAFQELPDNLKKGILGINMQLASILKDYDVTEIGQIGEDFDPNYHEALEDKGGDERISQILQKGYRSGTKVIRPAKVIVGE